MLLQLRFLDKSVVGFFPPLHLFFLWVFYRNRRELVFFFRSMGRYPRGGTHGGAELRSNKQKSPVSDRGL